MMHAPKRTPHPTPLPQVLARVGEVVLGKPTEIRLALACLLARGHLLIEDLPGMGKTTLAQALATALGLSFKRIQFTADLLPGDITGISIFDAQTQGFRFHPGPVFAQVLLADEINRATPKAQSALLEAMEEKQVTVDGTSHPLPEPFFVIATQNPRHQIGTFPLPESQLDRFLMRITLGYPERAAEREILSGRDRRSQLAELAPVLDAAGLAALQREAAAVHSSEALFDYVQDLVDASRASPAFAQGLSPRAALGWLAAARAWALIDGRHHVLPEDVQAVGPSVLGHRLVAAHTEAPGSVAALIQSVAIP